MSTTWRISLAKISALADKLGHLYFHHLLQEVVLFSLWFHEFDATPPSSEPSLVSPLLSTVPPRGC